LDEIEAAFQHLPGKPFVAVDIDLAGEGKHRLYADVHEAEVVIEKVEIQNALWLALKSEARPLVAVQQFNATAVLLATQDCDEAIRAWLFQEKLVDEFFLVGLGLEVLIGRVGLLGQLFGMIDETLRERLDEGKKVLPPYFQDAIDKIIEMPIAAKRQMAMKNDAIMAAEHGYNGGRESFDKAVHGVLLPTVVWQLPLVCKTPLSLSLRLRR
jgi:hypothetical protein